MTRQESARPEGYYWVSDGGAAPEIGELRDGEWWLIGCEEPITGLGLTVLGVRLTSPAPIRTGLSFDGVHGMRRDRL